jgi:endonuclease G
MDRSTDPKESVASDWVPKEARYAANQSKLFGLKLDATPIPDEFTRIEAALLQDWKGDLDHPEWISFQRSLATKASPSRRSEIRPGFDSRFLGEDRRIPWPTVFGPARQLHYLHFSVVANPARRLAWYVAYNVDLTRQDDLGQRPLQLREDALIDQVFQPRDAHYRGSGYDRGHLACRRSLGWGEDGKAAIAGRQAFFLTNTGPQNPQVNRGSYLFVERWEERLSLERGRLIVFCGPLLGDDDEPFRGKEVGDDGFVAEETFRIPQAYWKVIVTLGSDRAIEARAFIFPNPKPNQEPELTQGDATKLSVSLEQLQKLTPYLAFPDEVLSAREIEVG